VESVGFQSAKVSLAWTGKRALIPFLDSEDGRETLPLPWGVTLPTTDEREFKYAGKISNREPRQTRETDLPQKNASNAKGAPSPARRAGWEICVPNARSTPRFSSNQSWTGML
jgi:hypothetical protein